MTTSDSTPPPGTATARETADAPATKEELQRVVEERAAQAEAAETEPVVNPTPAKKRAPAKKAAAKKAPAKKAVAASSRTDSVISSTRRCSSSLLAGLLAVSPPEVGVESSSIVMVLRPSSS